MRTIDLNCDMGELPGMIADGTQEALMPYLHSVNIACGGHAGDEQTMSATIQQAQRRGLNIGAHPGYPDHANFGRLPMEMTFAEISDLVYQQILTLAQVARRHGAVIRHMKPHGALYNSAVKDEMVAEAIGQGAARWDSQIVLVGLAGSAMLDVFRAANFAVMGEAFADRRYEPDGSLRARNFADSMITDPPAAAQQANNIAYGKFVNAVDGSRVPIMADTLCIHGDTSGALTILKEVSRQLSSQPASIRISVHNTEGTETPGISLLLLSPNANRSSH